jgi:hypothetical protein
MNDFKLSQGIDVRYDIFLRELQKSVDDLLYAATKDTTVGFTAHHSKSARNLADRLGLAQQAAVMLRFGDELTTEAFMLRHFGEKEKYNNSSRGINFGGIEVYSDNICDFVIQRNKPIFYD